MDNIVHVKSALKMSNNNVEDVYLTIEEDALGKFYSSCIWLMYSFVYEPVFA